MALIPRIVEVSRDHTGHAYVLVEFRETRAGPVVLTEEFVMQIPEAVRDASGNPVTVDVREWMRTNIRNFAAMAELRGWRGDMTEGPPGQQVRQRDKGDTTGIVGTLKADVGQEVTRPGASPR